jgi:hypothetical protein
MNPEMKEFLSLAFRPERLTIQQAAWLLGFGEHEISLLIARGLLKPLGRPAHNGQKFFLTATLEDLRRDEKWFSKASDAVTEYWRHKNSRRSPTGTDRQGTLSGNGRSHDLVRTSH